MSLEVNIMQFIKDAEPLKEPIQRFMTPSLMNLVAATSKSGPIFYGRGWSWLDSSLSFAETALTSPIHLIVDLAKTIISGVFSICSKDARKFCKIHLLRSGIDVAAFGIGVVGTIYPEAGAWLTAKFISKLIDTEKFFNDGMAVASKAAFKALMPLALQEFSNFSGRPAHPLATPSASASLSLPIDPVD